jgi:hypothetical protein
MRVIFTKQVLYAEAWRPQYREVQQQINHVLTQVLHTHNGLASIPFIKKRLAPQDIYKLFTVYSEDSYEWLRKIQTIEKIALQLKVVPGDLPEWLTREFNAARRMDQRRAFPYLVPTDHRHLIRREASGQVYGFSILVRPVSEIAGGFVPREEIRISPNHLVIYLHCDMEHPSLAESFTRVLFDYGEVLPVDFRKLYLKLRARKNLIFDFLDNQKYIELVTELARITNNYIQRQYDANAEDIYSIRRRFDGDND